VFANDFAALRLETPAEKLEDGVLIAEGEPGICRVVSAWPVKCGDEPIACRIYLLPRKRRICWRTVRS